ncbi:conserved hypothetical protein [Paraburkholderia piptadeniae]|uniref:Uncharacterized protein n=2 Tax=Paraburkholderia piptadeniae TaxID=1701573 RepID=A0A1N7S8W2_9BURK|nr:conserved hypothetical protein [Paraburkholderia piptadeniae]
MENISLDPNDPMWSLARSMENTVRTIRKARGLRNPEDCVQGSDEHEEVSVEFLKDVMRLMGEDPNEIDEDDEHGDLGVGATG